MTTTSPLLAKFHASRLWVVAHADSLLAGALAVAAFVFCVRNLVFFFPRTVDDLFIYLRYAENFISGAGLVYNPGEWVEGYSSVTWLLVLAAIMGTGLDGVTATKILALASTLLMVVGFYRIGRGVFGMSRAWAMAAVLLVSVNSYILSWAVYGLETPLYLALLLWFGHLVQRVADGEGGRRARLALAVVGVALALVRPEAPLFMVAVGLGCVRVPQGRAPLWLTLRRLAAPAAAVIGGYGAWLLVRFHCYGLWVPHTYFAKKGEGFTWSNLAPLFSNGADASEIVWWPVVFICGLALALLTRRLLAPILFAVGLFFVARVEMDWMPNMRHFLPLWLLASLCLPAMAQRLSQWHSASPLWKSAAWSASLTLVLVGLWTGAWLNQLDSRFSPYDFETHGRKTQWVRQKTPESWASSLALLQRRDPPGYENAHPDHLGLIQELFVAVEASSQPEASSWYLGRDIGMVGYYSPIQIYDTDGLFTPRAIQYTGGRDRLPIADAAILEAFDPAPVAGMIFFEWAAALGRNQHLLKDYEILIGSLPRPHRFMQKAHPRPDAAQLAQRYARIMAKLPPHFHFAELYGNPASPAIALRARVVQERLQLTEEVLVSEASVPRFAGDGHVLDRAIRLAGCTIAQPYLSAGEQTLLSCYFYRVGPLYRSYWVFVHGDAHGRRLLHADHPLAHDTVDLATVAMGQAVVSRQWLRVPNDAPRGEVPVFVGLFSQDHRAQVHPEAGTDGDHRIRVGSLWVE